MSGNGKRVGFSRVSGFAYPWLCGFLKAIRIVLTSLVLLFLLGFLLQFAHANRDGNSLPERVQWVTGPMQNLVEEITQINLRYKFGFGVVDFMPLPILLGVFYLRRRVKLLHRGAESAVDTRRRELSLASGSRAKKAAEKQAVHLPRLAQVAPEESNPVEPSGLPRRKVLIADPYRTCKAFLRRTLSKDYEIIESDNAEEIMGKAAEEAPDILIIAGARDGGERPNDGRKLAEELTRTPLVLVANRSGRACDANANEISAEAEILERVLEK
ncbi:MAG: hypothetical protein HYS61_01225 [Acidobacteria bacterium]|nr:hypothetical protein [Acidobacteriota bacterium]